jgi:hypothetical protein
LAKPNNTKDRIVIIDLKNLQDSKMPPRRGAAAFFASFLTYTDELVSPKTRMSGGDFGRTKKAQNPSLSVITPSPDRRNIFIQNELA